MTTITPPVGEMPLSGQVRDFIDTPLTNAELRPAFALIRTLCGLGRSARHKSGVKLRTPLPRLIVPANNLLEYRWIYQLQDHLKEEINVKEIEVIAAPQVMEDIQRASMPSQSV